MVLAVCNGCANAQMPYDTARKQCIRHGLCNCAIVLAAYHLAASAETANQSPCIRNGSAEILRCAARNAGVVYTIFDSTGAANAACDCPNVTPCGATADLAAAVQNDIRQGASTANGAEQSYIGFA